jgi:Ca2+-binding EF-hand superfamily protein
MLFLLAQAAPAASAAAQPAASQPAPAQREAQQPKGPASRRRPPTKSEYEEQTKSNFQRIDGNRDGKVDRAEAEKAYADAIAAREKQQYEARNQIFARLDADKDGSISREELEALKSPPAASKEAWFDANDIDRNGTVVLNEALARAQRDFEKIDTNSNGVLSESELQSFRARMTRRN